MSVKNGQMENVFRGVAFGTRCLMVPGSSYRTRFKVFDTVLSQRAASQHSLIIQRCMLCLQSKSSTFCERLFNLDALKIIVPHCQYATASVL